MNTKKLALSALSGFVVMFAISGLWYMVAMKGYYNDQFADVNRAEFKMLWIVIGYLVWALLMAYVYPIGYKGGAPLNEGLRFGVLVGLISVLPLMLVLYGVYILPLTPTLVDIIYQVVEKGVGGIVIAMVYGSGAGSTS